MIEGMLEMALADVLSGALRTELEAAAGCRVVGRARSAFGDPPGDRSCLHRHRRRRRSTSPRSKHSSRPGTDREATKLELDDHAPVVQVVSLLLTQAVRDRSSDIHIEPQGDKVRVRFRVDGVLRHFTELPESMAQLARQPHQGHGRHEHRGAASAAGRPDRHRDRRPAPRHPREHRPDDLR